MSTILDSNKIDGIATTNDGSTLVMLICDHLDFDEYEHKHLLALQEKINSYIAFVEDKQYMQIEDFNKDFEDFIIEIAFMHSPSENCIKFLNVAQNQLEELKIRIQYEVG